MLENINEELERQSTVAMGGLSQGRAEKDYFPHMEGGDIEVQRRPALSPPVLTPLLEGREGSRGDGNSPSQVPQGILCIE